MLMIDDDDDVGDDDVGDDVVVADVVDDVIDDEADEDDDDVDDEGPCSGLWGLCSGFWVLCSGFRVLSGFCPGSIRVLRVLFLSSDSCGLCQSIALASYFTLCALFLLGRWLCVFGLWVLRARSSLSS